MAWGKAGSTTLSATGDTLTTTGMTASETNQFLFHTLASGNADTRYKYNGTDQMALRYNQNGGSDATSTSDTPPQQIWVAYGDHFNVNYMANVSGEEKLVITFDITASATGAGTAPQRMESVHKSVQSDQITEINISNGGGGDYLTDSNLTVLGSDLTPVTAVPAIDDVQDNSLFVEKENARRYWFSAGTAISFEDDYTSNSGWTQTGSKVTVDSGKSDWVDANAAATNDSLQQVIKSLGITLSDTAWTADFTYINNGGTVGGYPFVFQSGTGNYDSASNDAITMSEDNPNKIKINTKNGGTYVAGSSTIAVSSGTTYYIRIQRTSATDIKLSAFTDSARTTHTSGSPVTASNAGIANITGLTYVQHQNQTTGGGGTSNFEITDLKIYNNSTSAPTTATWTWENLISGFAGTWGKDPSDSQFEVSGGKINFLDNTSSTGDRTWLDLGTDVSTTKWLLRFKFNFSTLTSGTYYYEFDAGLSDTTVDNNTNQNFIGVRVLPSGFNNLWRPRVCDGSSSPRTGSTANITQSFSTGTDYFAEIKRTSASDWSISLSTTNAYDGDLQDNSYTDASGATGLRYFKFGDAVTNSGSGFTMQGVCDILEFYNGVTTPP